jgi:hypothetical protein
MQDKIVIGISFPKKILEIIDSQRGDVPRSRYLLRLLENTYDRKRNQDSLDRRFGSLQSSESRST